jgi:hypothetical protein
VSLSLADYGDDEDAPRAKNVPPVSFLAAFDPASAIVFADDGGKIKLVFDDSQRTAVVKLLPMTAGLVRVTVEVTQ